MESNYLAGRAGNAVNAILAAVGYNFKLLIAWLKVLLCALLVIEREPLKPAPGAVMAS